MRGREIENTSVIFAPLLAHSPKKLKDPHFHQTMVTVFSNIYETTQLHRFSSSEIDPESPKKPSIKLLPTLVADDFELALKKNQKRVKEWIWDKRFFEWMMLLERYKTASENHKIPALRGIKNEAYSDINQAFIAPFLNSISICFQSNFVDAGHTHENCLTRYFKYYPKDFIGYFTKFYLTIQNDKTSNNTIESYFYTLLEQNHNNPHYRATDVILRLSYEAETDEEIIKNLFDALFASTHSGYCHYLSTPKNKDQESQWRGEILTTLLDQLKILIERRHKSLVGRSLTAKNYFPNIPSEVISEKEGIYFSKIYNILVRLAISQQLNIEHIARHEDISKQLIDFLDQYQRSIEGMNRWAENSDCVYEEQRNSFFKTVDSNLNTASKKLSNQFNSKELQEEYDKILAAVQDSLLKNTLNFSYMNEIEKLPTPLKQSLFQDLYSLFNLQQYSFNEIHKHFITQKLIHFRMNIDQQAYIQGGVGNAQKTVEFNQGTAAIVQSLLDSDPMLKDINLTRRNQIKSHEIFDKKSNSDLPLSFFSKESTHREQYYYIRSSIKEYLREILQEQEIIGMFLAMLSLTGDHLASSIRKGIEEEKINQVFENLKNTYKKILGNPEGLENWLHITTEENDTAMMKSVSAILYAKLDNPTVFSPNEQERQGYNGDIRKDTALYKKAKKARDSSLSENANKKRQLINQLTKEILLTHSKGWYAKIKQGFLITLGALIFLIGLAALAYMTIQTGGLIHLAWAIPGATTVVYPSAGAAVIAGASLINFSDPKERSVFAASLQYAWESFKSFFRFKRKSSAETSNAGIPMESNAIEREEASRGRSVFESCLSNLSHYTGSINTENAECNGTGLPAKEREQTYAGNQSNLFQSMIEGEDPILPFHESMDDFFFTAEKQVTAEHKETCSRTQSPNPIAQPTWKP